MSGETVDIDIFSKVVPATGIPQADSKEGQSAYGWHVGHRRSDAPPSFPIRGFGKDGAFTLWLPNPQTSSGVQIIDGRSQHVVVPNAMITPEMAELRMNTMIAMRSPDGSLRFDLSLSDYACVIIRASYHATDEELTMLLSGKYWQEEVIRHLIGGDDQIDHLIRRKAAAPREAEKQIIYVPVPAEPVAESRPRASRWKFWAK